MTRWTAVVVGLLLIAAACGGGSKPSELRAVRAQDGSVLWTVAGAGAIPTAPSTDGSIVVARAYNSCGTGSAGLVAIDARNGHTLWRSTDHEVPQFSPRVSAALSDDTVVVSAAGRVRALEARTGALRWQRATVADGGALAGFGLAVVIGGGIDATRSGVRVEAFDLATGEPRWQASGPNGQVIGALVTTHGFVAEIFGAASSVPTHKLVQFDPTNGARRWLFDAGVGEQITPVRAGIATLSVRVSVISFMVPDPLTQQPTDVGPQLGVIVVDEATGQERWRRVGSVDPRTNSTTTAVVDAASGAGSRTAEIVYAHIGSDLVGLDAGTGAERWRRDGVIAQGGALVAVGDLVVVAGATTRAFRGDDGRDAWTARGSSVVGGDGSVVVTATHGAASGCGD